MSERMYTYLLRLFPSAFRSQYQDEALRLYRDRLRDERGFLRRMRLVLDLITDIARALPQAYGNSYSEVAAAAPLVPQVDHVPSFQTLQQEPLQRGTVAIASVLSVTAFAIFTFVIGRLGPSFSSAQNGPMSPIQAVIEHLNQPMSPDSVDDNGNSSAPSQASPDKNNRSEARSSSPAVLSGMSLGASTNVNLPARAREQTPDASYSSPQLSVVFSSSLAKVQSEPIREAVRSPTSSYVPAQTPTAAIANLSGRWSMSSGAGKGDIDIPQWFIFRQDGEELTGIGGLNSAQHYPIVHGSVNDSSVSFQVDIGKGRLLYNLRLEGETLRGILSVSGTNEGRSTSVWLRRVQ